MKWEVVRVSRVGNIKKDLFLWQTDIFSSSIGALNSFTLSSYSIKFIPCLILYSLWQFKSWTSHTKGKIAISLLQYSDEIMLLHSQVRNQQIKHLLCVWGFPFFLSIHFTLYWTSVCELFQEDYDITMTSWCNVFLWLTYIEHKFLKKFQVNYFKRHKKDHICDYREKSEYLNQQSSCEVLCHFTAICNQPRFCYQ